MTAWAEIVGGVGLFLFGMAVMTSGLRKLAGERLRVWLGRSTQNPVSGACTGAAFTALIQSSSATTLAAMGFVGAGLLSFPQALGIIFGANIGTTLTGWMVALIGFKLKLTTAALPLLAVASALYLVKQRRSFRATGKALAGFCLIFIGIAYLQEGLSSYRGVIDFGHWPAQGVGGRLLLLVLGVVLTMITQSSSATVAMVLSALHTSVLTLPQAAAVIIGADIGTTFTAAIATIGASTAARRTGFAHVVYNLLTGMVAFLLLPLYLWLCQRLAPAFVADSPEVAAVAFHSVFNTLGVLLILPFTYRFAAFIEHLFPEREGPLVRAFDPHLLNHGQVAAAALRHGIDRLGHETLMISATLLDPEAKPPKQLRLLEVQQAVPEARRYAMEVSARSEEAEVNPDLLYGCLHALDQIERLSKRAKRQELSDVLTHLPGLAAQARESANLMQRLAQQIANPPPDLVVSLEEAASRLDEEKEAYRQRTIRDAVSTGWDAEALEQALNAQRWVRRLTYHAWRLAVHSPSHENGTPPEDLPK